MTRLSVRFGLLSAFLPAALVVSLGVAQQPERREIRVAGVVQDQADFVKQGRRCGTRPVGQAEQRALANRAKAFRDANVGPLAELRKVTVPVFFHVIHKGAEGKVTQARLDQQLAALNTAFSNHGVTFTQSGVDYTDNASWYAMDYGSPEEEAAKTALNVDTKRTLNIYTAGLPGLLGWATWPWELTSKPAMDGVVIVHTSLPGGNPPYDLGMTAAHEAGHWLGLFHVFGENPSDPCEDSDECDDTPACHKVFGTPAEGTDTCPTKPGVDPIHNYMAYTDDSHLTELTPNQKGRMFAQVSIYRPLLLSTDMRSKLKR